MGRAGHTGWAADGKNRRAQRTTAVKTNPAEKAAATFCAAAALTLKVRAAGVAARKAARRAAIRLTFRHPFIMLPVIISCLNCGRS